MTNENENDTQLPASSDQHPRMTQPTIPRSTSSARHCRVWNALLTHLRASASPSPLPVHRSDVTPNDVTGR